jgi:hypothetical protein
VEGVGVARRIQEGLKSTRVWRVTAGIGVLVILLLVSIVLVPPYLENFRLQRYVDGEVGAASQPEILQAHIVNHAAQLGLPVLADDVKVTRTRNGLRVNIVYVVRVDLPLYTVDLHFHPAAGG